MLSRIVRPSRAAYQGCHLLHPHTAVSAGPGIASSPVALQYRCKYHPTKERVRKIDRIPPTNEALLRSEDKEALENELQKMNLFDGQAGVIFEKIVKELVADNQRYRVHIAPDAISYLYSCCQNVDQLQHIRALHKRFRASEGDLGGGSHSISHNAIVACLRLDQHETALDLLMDKYYYSVWPPATTYSLLLDFLLAKLHDNPDLLSEVYEVPCIVQRDKVSCNSTLASLCVVALTLPNPEDPPFSEEVDMDRNPPLPFSKMTVPDWEFHKVLEHGRVPPYWHDKLETRYERLVLAHHMLETHRCGGSAPLFPIAYCRLVSTLTKAGMYRKAVSVLEWAEEDGIDNHEIQLLNSRLMTEKDQAKFLQGLAGRSDDDDKIGSEENSEMEIPVRRKKKAAKSKPAVEVNADILDKLAGPLPRLEPPKLTHTTDGLKQIEVLKGVVCDLDGTGLSGDPAMRPVTFLEPNNYFEGKRGMFRVRSRYKMPGSYSTVYHGQTVDDYGS